MKILFKDKVDLYDELKDEYPDAFFVGSREPITKEMEECDVLSVKTTIVDSDLIKKLPNLKWVINRSNISDNIIIKHCQDRNIGVINTYPAAINVSDWIEDIIKNKYYLPYYTICGDGVISESFKDKFKYVHLLDCGASEAKIKGCLAETNTLIITASRECRQKPFVDKKVLGMLPRGTRLISVSKGLVINNEDLLQAIHDGIIEHADIDRLHASHRDELIKTGKVTFHKFQSWKHKIDVEEYVENIKEHIDSVKYNEPMNVLVERHEKKIDVFWD